MAFFQKWKKSQKGNKKPKITYLALKSRSGNPALNYFGFGSEMATLGTATDQRWSGAGVPVRSAARVCCFRRSQNFE